MSAKYTISMAPSTIVAMEKPLPACIVRSLLRLSKYTGYTTIVSGKHPYIFFWQDTARGASL
jgi:hypothetical protein